jgi:DNA-binding FrmR family transcriptional regulator
LLPEYKHDAIHRLKAAIGHLKAVEDMVESERYCIDIMKQLAAVQASLEGVQQVLLKNHLSTCVTDAIVAGSGEALIGELVAVLKYAKGIPDAIPAGGAVPPAPADASQEERDRHGSGSCGKHA